MPPLVKTKKSVRVKKSASRKTDFLEFKNIDRSVEVALYYGFTPLLEPLKIVKEDTERAQTLQDKEPKRSSCFHSLLVLEEKVALMRLYHDKKLNEGPQPVLLFGELDATQRKKEEGARVGLDIIGAPKSIAEAMLIQTARAILKNEGVGETVVAINSVGDRECAHKFSRELFNYYRKHIALLPPSCRAALRKNPLEVLECTHEKCRLLGAEAPRAISFLSEGSRQHFKEVLEYLEELDIPYRIEPLLIGSRSFSTETVFEIRSAEADNKLYAVGCRYNNLARRLGSKRDIPSTGVTLLLPEKENRIAKRIRLKKPSIFFLQLGFEAKLKSLKVIELLREQEIPLYQALARDKLVSQLSTAENLKIPYSIIMGQKEAIEDAVIVRDTSTRAQETVKIANLPAYIQKLKLA